MSEQCQQRVWHEYDYYKCTRKGVVFEDEQWHCKQHSKTATEARQTKSDQRYAEEGAQRKARWNAEAEQKRRAECFPALLEALEARPGNRASWETKWLEEEAMGASPDADAVRWELRVRAAIAQAKPEGGQR